MLLPEQMSALHVCRDEGKDKKKLMLSTFFSQQLMRSMRFEVQAVLLMRVKSSAMLKSVQVGRA
jgi:hypothetical protein